MSLNTENFERKLREMLAQAKKIGFSEVTINAGILHRKLGGYPGENHRMPTCCGAMRNVATLEDQILPDNLVLNGASFSIRYQVSNN